jgi:hypothetical protein
MEEPAACSPGTAKKRHTNDRVIPLVAVQRYLRLKVVLKVAGRDWAAHPPPVQLQPEH